MAGKVPRTWFGSYLRLPKQSLLASPESPEAGHQGSQSLCFLMCQMPENIFNPVKSVCWLLLEKIKATLNRKH